MESESHRPPNPSASRRLGWEMRSAPLLTKVEAQWGEPAHMKLSTLPSDWMFSFAGEAWSRLRERFTITAALSKVETIVFEDAYGPPISLRRQAIESTWEERVLSQTDLLAGGIQASDEKVAVLDCCGSREPGKTRELLGLAGQPAVRWYL